MQNNTEAGVEEIMDSVKSYARQYYVTAEENDSEENLKRKEEEIRKALHHQLQKAQQDWLREEIVKLEGMKRELFVEGPGMKYLNGAIPPHNKALQTIIDRYQEELDQATQLLDETKKDWDAQADDLMNGKDAANHHTP